MSFKRRRTDEEEACEALGGLLRQTAARAVERVRMQRQQRAAGERGSLGVAALSSSAAEAVVRTAKPMDVLVIRFCMHYLDCSRAAGPTQFLRLAQNIVTSSVERVFVPQLFAKGNASLPALCESLVAEHTAEEIQTAVKEINEFVEARGALGAWLTEAAERAGRMDDDDDDDEAYGGAWDRSAKGRDERYGGFKSEEEEVTSEGAVDAVGTTSAETGEELAEPPSPTEEFALASTLYKACEYWVRVQAFLNALSLHSARLHVFKMPPRYERELLLLLYSATRGTAVSGKVAVAEGQLPPPAEAADGIPTRDNVPNAFSVVKGESSSTVKKEPAPDPDDRAYAAAENGVYRSDADDDSTEDDALPSSPTRQPRQLYKSSALLADVLALSRCPAPTSSKDAVSSPTATSAPRLTAEASRHLRGVNPEYYKMVYARLGLMVARDRLHRFDQSSSVNPPELIVQQRNLQEQLQQQQLSTAAAATALPGQMEAGLPTSYVPDDAYYDKLLQQQNDTVEEDEEVYKGEVMDYYLSHPGRYSSSATAAASASSRSRQHGGARNSAANNGDGEAPLMKPHRFCKVKTGYSWTQYNRTHYDSRTNPPPRTEMWYEFTLFYPALANTKRDMRHIFRIEDAPEGPNDQYCLLVFSVGPPYADVAYRIRKKQWDTRRGGVRISFDQTGRYKLFFRFTNSNYRR
ncbi:hypothetical protein ABB37_01549 [Leptomonas pyrrhocoris]|uniref:Splicing factor Cactin C-terminal domain-containing protein n=1 Tax=Leptomonas pyrrhocoris TaxID=157538 RepID=A0A0N0DZG8_LEPPY|nr:hypothetical protein ABB37_01549 [Leptomonas pyrrhocoris]KPA85182.1 hypothetical protein ABB37_01549 [Leptomonas pyrrhocoris]|eukprot:XP_015663621.1 hypothetical protein ABB37_01549 [Leptomonas pyrrhocoris]